VTPFLAIAAKYPQKLEGFALLAQNTKSNQKTGLKSGTFVGALK